MAHKKIWTLYRINPEDGIYTERDVDSPLTRSVALRRAEEWARHGWRVWVERKDTGVRIFQSDAEKREFVKRDRQVILCFPRGFFLRVIHDDASEKRLRLNAKRLPEARKAAIDRGFVPTGFVSMDSLGRLVCCFNVQ